MTISTTVWGAQHPKRWWKYTTLLIEKVIVYEEVLEYLKFLLLRCLCPGARMAQAWLICPQIS